MVRAPHPFTVARGFTVVELSVSIAIVLTVLASVFGLMNPVQGIFRTQPEVSDLQQRLRIATDTLQRHLLMAGAGAYSGSGQSGSLGFFFASVLPYRIGRVREDAPGTFRTDTITILYVPPTAAQATIRGDLSPSATETVVEDQPGCPAHTEDEWCGFQNGMPVLIYDDTGAWDTFEISEVRDDTLHLRNKAKSRSHTYQSGARIAEVAQHTYYLRGDDSARTSRLMHYDGGANDVPVVDDVVGVEFEYYGEPEPPVLLKAMSEPRGPWTTYGPSPRNAVAGWPAGENCAFLWNGSPAPAPRLARLGAEGQRTLVRLTADRLTDGPWCPAPDSPRRFDADLLRIRKVAVRLRLQAADDRLRGPEGILFRKTGRSPGGAQFVPDIEIAFEVSPRNLGIGR